MCYVSNIAEIPSFHTDIVSPDNINSLYCYNSKKVLSKRKVITYNRYWTNLIEKEVQSERDYYVFTYIDGKYLFNLVESVDDKEFEKVQLIEINGKNVDDYIIEEASVFKLYYDGVNNKPCRTRLVLLHNSDGEMVKLKIKLS